MRRSLAAAAALLASSVLVAPPAQAAGDCRVSNTSKVAITSPYKEVKVVFSGECTTDNGYGSWEVLHPTEGPVDYLIYDADYYEYGTTQYMGIYDWEPLGTWTIRGEGAWDGDYNSLKQNERTMTVKLGSKTSFGTSRSGSRVTLTAKPTYYSPDARAYRAWKGATVKFYSKNSDGSWTLRKTATTDSTGMARVVIDSSSARVWKAVTADVSNKWGSTSATSTR